MSKALFRWLRGELNGFYLQAIYNTLNKSTNSIKDFLIKFSKQQFNPTDMDSETIYNIGKFAGVFLPRLSVGESYGSLRMTESHMYGENERSERGLLNRDTETFNFVHTEQDEYEDDINTLATENDKSSLIGSGAVPLGYISSEDTDVIDSNGNVKTNKILSSPPQGVAYTNYYGSQFLFLSESIEERKNIDSTMYYNLYKIMQWIRYNGANIVSFCKLVETICPFGLVVIESITKHTNYACFIVSYRYDLNLDIDSKSQRLATLLYIVSLKFPQFIMEEIAQ